MKRLDNILIWLYCMGPAELRKRFAEFDTDLSAAHLIEYALVAVLIVIVVILVLNALGLRINEVFRQVLEGLGG